MREVIKRTILIVEDSPEDYQITLRAFRESNLGNPVVHCEDGEEALDYLYSKIGDKDTADDHLPGLILLDLNLPGTDGREVLQEIKSNERLKLIPIIVLTTSNDDRDIKKCYQYGANSYVQKPVELDKFLKAIQHLKEYWFEIVVLPKQLTLP